MAIYGPFEVHFAALAQNNYAEVYAPFAKRAYASIDRAI